MKLWLLRPVDPNTGPWNPWYDKAFGFVIRAPTARQARVMAQADAGDEAREYPKAWLDPALSSCQELKPDGKAGLVLRDFYAA
jgi:hypothetical protein